MGRVILAEDGSPAGMAARDLVGGWPAFASVPILVVGVVDVAAPWRSGIAPTMFAAAMDVYSDMLATARGAHREIVAATEHHLRGRGFTVTGELREGDPADQLRLAATDPGGDLIVVGSRGYVGITRLVMGSVAHAVLTHARCSVLVVKEPHDAGNAPGP